MLGIETVQTIIIYQGIEAEENRKAERGFIGVHPDHGIFLGYDDQEDAIFVPLSELDPAQPIPVVFHPEYARNGYKAFGNPDVFDMPLYRVHVSDVESQTTFKKDVTGQDGELLADEITKPQSCTAATAKFNRVVDLTFTFGLAALFPESLIRYQPSASTKINPPAP